MKITEVSIKRPLAVSMVFLAIILFGFISVTNLPVALFPDVTFPMIIVMTSYPGAAPEEIETQITDPLEQSLATVNNLDKITSSTQENIAMIILEFEWGTDLDAASSDVRDILGFIVPYMPEDADYPLIFKFDISQQPVVMYTVGGDIDVLELDEIADDDIDDDVSGRGQKRRPHPQLDKRQCNSRDGGNNRTDVRNEVQQECNQPPENWVFDAENG